MESGSPYVKVAGMDVERDALRVAEAVNDYDPNLRVQYLESEAKLGEPPFRILERGRLDGLDRVVFTFWVLDDRVLDRIRNSDTQMHDIQALIEKANAQAKADEEAKHQESMDEAAEIAKAVLRSPKDSYTVGDTEFRN